MVRHITLPSDVGGFIFDCDGTLVDSMPLHLKAWQEVITKAGALYDEEFFHAMKGMKETEIVDVYNKRFGTSLDSREIVQAKHIVVLRNIHTVQPITPIVALAEKYRGKLPMAVASGSVREIVVRELEVLGILSWFCTIVTADDPVRPKPEPDIFLEAARRMNVPPQRCLVFEDGDLGLCAAERAGMKSIDVRFYL